MTLRDYFEARARDGSWGALYATPEAPDLASYNFLTRRAAVFELLAGEGPFERVLDVGCGTGDYAELAGRHGGRFFGVDFAETMVREARRRTDGRYAVGAGDRLPYRDGAFDLVLALGYIAYFSDPRPPLAELRRVLRPGGVLVMQCAKPDLVGSIDRGLLIPLAALLRTGAQPRTSLPDGWVNVKYSERVLDQLARTAGFERRAHAFNHFNALPGFLKRRYPRRAIRLSEAMTRSGAALWRFLAVNYIGVYTAR